MGNFLNNIVFQPPPCSYGRASFPGLALLARGEDTVATVTIRHGPSPPELLVFFSHGNAEDLGEIYPYLNALCGAVHQKLNEAHSGVERGVALVSYDYPGYGLSSGPPSEAAVFETARLAFKHALETLQVERRKVILYGRSLGSGPTCFLARCCRKSEFDGEDSPPKATAHPTSLANSSNDETCKSSDGVKAIILQSPLLSVLRVGLRSTSRIPIPFDMFRNLERVQRGFGPSVPVFIIHGTLDTVVPFDHGEKLTKILRNASSGTATSHRHLFVEGAGHNDLEYVLSHVTRVTLEEHVANFVSDVL